MNFYAYLNRMKYIERWSLMRNSNRENIMEHCHQVAVIAHSLAVINNKIFGGSANIEKTVLTALYHDVSEVITGDLPAPIKYFNADILGAYKNLEHSANDKLLKMLPEDFQEEYKKYLMPDTRSIEYKLCKGADKLAAYIKCIEELQSGNGEFKKAKQAIEKILQKSKLDAVRYFYKNIIPCYQKTLDELD